jgi:polysaccharide biosynthesis/export protein ExoF
MRALHTNFAVQLKCSSSVCLLAAASLLLFSAPLRASDRETAFPDSTVSSETVSAVASTTADTVVAAPSSSRQEELMIGDKVQVSFFEQLDLGQGADAGLTADTRTFYQRLDLTGEHVVGADGAISIPLLGRFRISGMTPEEGEAQIIDAYRNVMGRTGDVDISITERKPVFVTGIVKAPGSFRFEPGMMVAQAIALAGGYDRGAEAAGRLIEAQRERERHDQAVERLQRLEAKRARLIEQRDAPAGGDAGTERQSNVEGGGTNNIIQGETRLLLAEQAAASGEDNLQQTELVNAKAQVASLRDVLSLIGDQVAFRSERLRVLQQVQGQGFSSIENLWNAQKEVGELRMQQERLTAELGSAEQSVVKVEAEGIKLATGRSVQIERELVGIEDEIEQQKTVIDASERMIAALEMTASGARLGEPLRVQILRRTPGATETINADETTDLFPGDVVKVEILSGGDGAVASAERLIQ